MEEARPVSDTSDGLYRARWTCPLCGKQLLYHRTELVTHCSKGCEYTLKGQPPVSTQGSGDKWDIDRVLRTAERLEKRAAAIPSWMKGYIVFAVHDTSDV